MSTDGAGWFVDVLRRVPRLVVDPDLCQEDWGVVVFAARDGFKFWFGLSFWDEGEWLAHAHHRGVLQRFRAAGKAAYAAVISAFHVALAEQDVMAEVTWYLDDADLGGPRGAPSPDAR